MSHVTDWCPECEHNLENDINPVCKNCYMILNDMAYPSNFKRKATNSQDWHEYWCDSCQCHDIDRCNKCQFDDEICYPTMFVDSPEHPFLPNESQKAKADAGKPKLTLVPREIIYAIARVREYGNAKYPNGGPDNWKLVEPERYRDALFRHLLLYLDDPYGVDAESGLKHLDHIACNVAFLCELEKEEK